MHIVEFELPFPFDKTPVKYDALGVWERNKPGEDGKVEVYIPGHRPGLGAFGEFGKNPDGLEQTKIELNPNHFHYLGSYIHQG